MVYFLKKVESRREARRKQAAPIPPMIDLISSDKEQYQPAA
jgi:hypothetical protein